MIVERLSEQKPQEALRRIKNYSRKQKTVKEQPKANKMAPTKEKG